MKAIDRQRYHEVVPIKRAVEDDLLALPGVTGVDVGYKQVGGEQTDEMAVLVFVRQKGRFDEAHRIPSSVQGVPTDVIECEFRPLSVGVLPAEADAAINARRYDPVVGGCAVAPARLHTKYGTLGVLVLDNASGKQAYLSNWHVLCGAGWNAPGMDHRVVQPAIVLHGKVPEDVIGSVYAGQLGRIAGPSAQAWYVDCALCDATGRAATPGILTIGPLKGSREPIVGELVRKHGAKTSFTYGEIQSTDFTTSVDYDGVGTVTFRGQYRIAAPSPTMPPFSQPGDSGSVVVDTENYAVGLNFAGGQDGSSYYSVANPMHMVLGALNISLITS